MSYEDLLGQIYQELPHLKGQLQSPRVVYVKAQEKVYITFDSLTLAEENHNTYGVNFEQAFPFLLKSL